MVVKRLLILVKFLPIHRKGFQYAIHAIRCIYIHTYKNVCQHTHMILYSGFTIITGRDFYLRSVQIVRVRDRTMKWVDFGSPLDRVC